MKYLHFFFLLFLFSCKKDNDPNSSSSYIKATINGTAWESSGVQTVMINPKWMAFVSDKIVLWQYDTVAAHFNFRVNTVNLLQFRTVKTESDLRLTWQTADETNNKFFIIEESRDFGLSNPFNWLPVDTVLSAGAGNHNYEYLYKDTGWHRTYTFFRLKMVDSSNLSAYSQVTMINSVGAHFKATGEGFRRGYNGTMTVTGSTGNYLTGTFSFTAKSLSGELIKVENGQFRCKYKNL